LAQPERRDVALKNTRREHENILIFGLDEPFLKQL